MTESHTVVFLDELKRMEIACPNQECGVTIEFDVRKEAGAIPAKCPACGREFGTVDESVSDAVHRFRAFCRMMESFKLKPRFRIPAPPPKSS